MILGETVRYEIRGRVMGHCDDAIREIYDFHCKRQICYQMVEQVNNQIDTLANQVSACVKQVLSSNEVY